MERKSTHAKYLLCGFALLYLGVLVNLLTLQIENLRLSKQYLAKQQYREALFYLGQCLREASPISWVTNECRELATTNTKYANEMQGYLSAANAAVWNYPESLLFGKRQFSEFKHPFDPNPYWAMLVHVSFLSFLVLVAWQLSDKYEERKFKYKFWIIGLTCSLIVWMISARLA